MVLKNCNKLTLFMRKLINLNIDNNEVEVLERISIIEACESLGITVPRFCYHEILSVSGNCRMCVVEVDTVEKPVASCATEAKEGMDVYTNNAFVKKARENVVEMLLLNHPLDCPICDQAGECDLQDQAKAYGPANTRFYGVKKTSEDKLCNPFIKTIMTRCITCTRCVRYASEVAGVEYFGTLNRGTGTEIGSYTSSTFISEISANVVDLCPVGALTSAPYAFHGRPWELKSTESLDISDALGSNLYVNHKENVIYRLLPKNTLEINNSILSDIGRFSFEHTRKNRILASIKNEASRQFLTHQHEILYKEVKNNLDAKNKLVNIVIDETIDLDTLLYVNYLKKIMKYNVIVNDKTSITSNNFIVNKQYSIRNYFDSVKDYFFLIGANLRMENAVLNSKLRFKYRTKDIEVLTSGFNYSSNVPNDIVFLNVNDILGLFEGLYNSVSYNFLKKKDTLLIFGKAFFQRVKNYYSVKNIFENMTNNHKVIELYNHANSEITKMFNTKALNNKVKSKSAIYLNVEDTISVKKIFSAKSKEKNLNTKTIWINPNTSLSSRKADYNFPSKSHFEDEFHYVSLGYRYQKTNKTGELQPGIKKICNILQGITPTKRQLKNVNYISKTLLENNESLDLVDYHKNLISNNLSTTSTYQKYPMKQEVRNFYEKSRFTDNSNSLNTAAEAYNTAYKNF